jgi:hypothetical protein
VNNTRADKLDSFMWRYSFAERRCVIPVTQLAEAEGEAGHKTRAWFALPDEPVFGVAEIWADTPEWGPTYSIVMAQACIHVADAYHRMPVILQGQDWPDCLDGGPESGASGGSMNSLLRYHLFRYHQPTRRRLASATQRLLLGLAGLRCGKGRCDIKGSRRHGWQ